MAVVNDTPHVVLGEDGLNQICMRHSMLNFIRLFGVDSVVLQNQRLSLRIHLL
jgi:hypothetical protein